MPSSPPATSPVQCNNGGELLENACLCPEEYSGLTCEIANFCNETMENGFTFNKTTVGRFSYSNELCNTTGSNAGWPKATARCAKTNGLAHFQEPQTMTCGTILSDLREKEVIIAAVTTISQLLNANSSKFSSQNSNATKSLTLALEKFSLTQNVSLNGSAIVQPNLAVQSVSLPGGFTRGIQFSVVSRSPRRATNVGFVLYQNDKFFRSSAFMTPLGTSRNVISASISSRRRGNRKVVPEFVELLYQPVVSIFSDCPISLPIHDGIFEDFACVFWDYNLGDWSTRGCAKSRRSNESSLEGPTVGCICNHTTNFAVLMSPIQPVLVVMRTDISEPLCTVRSNCWMSNSTLMLVCSYLSLLLFNLLFLIGANNRPHPRGTNHDIQNHLLVSDRHTDRDVGSCTTVAALTHFFLLASFTWNTLFTTETLLIRLKKGSSQKTSLSSLHINLGSSAIGWGFPLLLVSMTLALWYQVDNPLNYRQEEFCWLAALDETRRFDPRKPMLWSFLIPVGLVLILNIIELVYFMATTAKRAQRHNNRKADSDWNVVKEFLSSLSLAVLLVLSSLLGYLMLLNHDPDVHSVLSIVFCIFNVIQALQIFLLIPDWQQVFSVMPSLPSPAVSLGLHSKKYHVRPQQSDGTQEVYRKMETGFISSFQPLPPSLESPSEPEEKEP
ncbi:hypothetical protein Z043_104626 [Scleropages formosus]|uniref:Uncharacterized protein n=1 Tax=Scleropages formosus TaxID=113540 RepID=A0A0P7XI05_SCLFO|nr:hypothetical protein Z043_104626 [Scleropages formosus]